MGEILKIKFLGPFEVVRETAVVTPTAPKLRSVLALLALNAHAVVGTHQLIEELWGDRPPPSSTTTLQTYVYQLRKTLGLGPSAEMVSTLADRTGQTQPALNTTMNGYVLALGHEAVDAQEFVDLALRGRSELGAGDLEAASASFRSALSMWRGPALADVQAGPLLQAEVVRLEEVRKSVLESRIDIDLRLGRHHEVIGELIRIVSQQPIHEGFHAKLMLAFYQAGRRSEALLAYQRARAALTRELGLEPSAELQNLQRRMLAGETVMETGDGFVVPSARRAEPPSQLPAAAPLLIGRTNELASVERALGSRAATYPVVLVVGPPGVGKSAFAVHVAHRVRSAYPDGEFHARLITPDGSPVPPETVLADFLRAVGVRSERMPATLEQRRRMFANWTSTRRVLIVLDDAVDTEGFLPLLPAGRGSAVLLTCRRRVAAPALTATVDVRPLSPDDARRALAETLGPGQLAQDPDTAAELVKLCGGLPRALRVVQDQGQLRPHWPLGRLLRRFQAEPGRLDGNAVAELGMLDSVAHSYRLLSENDQVALQILASLGAGPVSAADAAEALGVDRTSAETVLESLVECHLAGVEAGLDPVDEFLYQIPPAVRAAVAVLGGDAREQVSVSLATRCPAHSPG
ncbi:AfsR/SARP family transcriptional regulator [Streptomyces acidicola]|uniref:AfsR/SARP family transcriptional regulator n=1 Tax=Streptomyces acidicola TaxID=2596892 RepID=UPI0037F1177D